MIALCLALVFVGLCVSLPTTELVRRWSLRTGRLDTEAIAGQLKTDRRRIPNTGGVGIFLGLVLPMAAAIVVAFAAPALGVLNDPAAAGLAGAVAAQLPGVRSEAPLGMLVLGCLAALHVLGIIDDRHPLGPFLKLGVMLAPGLLVATAGGTRLLELLDGYPGGVVVSVAITVVWFAAITNAMNFLDNMDGLAGGVGAIASAALLAVALLQGEWFVAAMLALLLGSLLGFLILNFPPAKIFMGDGGSLVLGFSLAFLTVRATYTDDAVSTAAGGWFALLTPLVVLAVPLYDMISVCVIRLRQGRSPFVGDLSHFSHRLVNRGLSRRAAVLVIYGCTLVTGLGGVMLGSLQPWQALVVGLQTLAICGLIALFEWRSGVVERRADPHCAAPMHRPESQSLPACDKTSPATLEVES